MVLSIDANGVTPAMKCEQSNMEIWYSIPMPAPISITVSNLKMSLDDVPNGPSMRKIGMPLGAVRIFSATGLCESSFST